MKRTWWKESIVYQIYPRSFQDSNGDGFGDIRGIIHRLDYIKSLGVDLIWLCPVYQSPDDDNGYDISDYYQIGPKFGTMADFEELLRGVHARQMRLIMDLVVNHTSDEHPWFVESRSAVDAPKRDYYIWKQPKYGEPPNNWESIFEGSAWEWDAGTQEYYLHLFTKKQPDLNWENPAVREEVQHILRYWLDKGVDGFRMDVISLISKRPGLPDTTYAVPTDTYKYVYANGPKIHTYLREINQQVLQAYDCMTVGEGPGIDLENVLDYVGEDREELHTIFHFDHMFIDFGPDGKYDPVPLDFSRFKRIFRSWDEKLKGQGWASIFLGNHDFSRMVSRFGNDGPYHDQAAKLLALLLLTHRGTPYIYQGDEIGMTNVAYPTIDYYDDVETRNAYFKLKAAGKSEDQLMHGVHQQSRDNARTPVQWSEESFGGFSTGEPWLKVNPNYKTINVAAQESGPNSILNFYRAAIAIRKASPTLTYGDYTIIQEAHEQVYAYWRWDEEGQFLVVLNFSDKAVPFEPDDRFPLEGAEVLIGNYPGSEYLRERKLQPWEGLLIQVN